jgi:hypothetical protein
MTIENLAEALAKSIEERTGWTVKCQHYSQAANPHSQFYVYEKSLREYGDHLMVLWHEKQELVVWTGGAYPSGHLHLPDPSSFSLQRVLELLRFKGK